METTLNASRGIDFTLWLVFLATLLAVAWFTLRTLAGGGNSTSVKAYHRLDPIVQALTVWVRASPATVVYVSCWVATTLLVQGTPKRLVDVFTQYNSTNIDAMVSEPLRALVVSALLVAQRGFGLGLYLLAFALIVARVEQKLGTPRTLVVWLAAHFGGSVLTVLCEELLLRANWISDKVLVTADVGVSYVMVGSFGAYLLLVGPRLRRWYVLAVVVGIVGQLVLNPNVWGLGHVFATLLGLLSCWLLLRHHRAKPGLQWDTLKSVPPRPLPKR